jgi:Ca2+-binding EF-hand superfamily protein
MRSPEVIHLLQKIEERVFVGKHTQLQIFKQFDSDGDGYITQNDVNAFLDKMGVEYTYQGACGVMKFLGKQGHCSFSEFAAKVRPDILQHNARALKLDMDSTGSSM